MSESSPLPTFLLANIPIVPEYISLLREFIELKKLLVEKETERLAIETEYELQRIELEGRIQLMEDYLTAELGSWEAMVRETHKHIAKLIEQREFEIAKFMFEILADRFKERAQQPLRLWNTETTSGTIRIVRRN